MRPERAYIRLQSGRKLDLLDPQPMDEGLLGYDALTPLKPHLGDGYARLVQRLRGAISARYDLPAWDRAGYEAHKHADRLAAASEAYHVVG